MSPRDKKEFTTIGSNMSSNSAPTPGGSASVGTPSGDGKDTHKRRRVTRACDECRKKKVKCDGKQPCIHCTVYSYNCTYQSPNSRNKKSAIVPEKQNLSMLANAVNGGVPYHWDPNNGGGNSGNGGSDDLVHSLHNNGMYKNILKLLLPKLNLDDENNTMNFVKLERVYNYLSKVKSPGAITMDDVYELYTDGPSASAIAPSTGGHVPSPRRERQLSVSSMDDSVVGAEIKIILPSKDVALKLIYTTWNEACVLFRFYHRPSLMEEVDLLYSIDPGSYTDRQQKFLPFMYSILATGSLFSKLRNNMTQSAKNHNDGNGTNNNADIEGTSNESLEDDGFRYFLAARKLIDITNVGDIISIQTIVMMVLYLQCSARLSTCYSYIGIGLRSALKEGLHRNLSIFQGSKKNKLTPIEIDTRQRLFYTIYKMDIYINSLLGLPRSIHEDEFDQEFPVELDDEYITTDGFNYEAQGGRLSSAGCANHHTKLMLIISHIVKDLYPIKLNKPNGGGNKITPEYTHAKVTEIEYELKTWLDNLPMELKPTDPNVSDSNKNIPKKFMLANCYLHLAFLNCQIMLYRPFIHFISNGSINKKVDPRSLIRGRNCIKVARMVVKLANKMIDQNLLIGTYWFSMYTIFFSIACLIYYFHFANYANNDGVAGVNYAGVLFDDDLNIDMIKQDIQIGRKVLDCLKNNSNSSLRIFNILKNLFEQLNRRTATNSASEVETFNGSGSNAQQLLQKQSQAKDENVQSTFLNFDSMNNYKNVASTTPYNPTFETLVPLVTDPQKDQALGKTSGDATSSSSSNATAEAEYIPGVFDKLDAQIFGRILPPYMLEKNAKFTAAVNGLTNGNLNSNNNSHTNSSANLASGYSLTTGDTGNSAAHDENEFGDVNFEDLEKLMFENTIDHLDPFNPL